MKRDPAYDPNRYNGKPFLAVLDQFVLSVAMEPDPEVEATLSMIVEKIWGEKGPWKAMIIKHMEFGPTILESLKQMYLKNCGIAKDQGLELSPWQFAKMVSDQNFSQHIARIDR